MHKPLVSVIMPNYNTKPRYLIEAIQSILNQTYKNFEFIIVDDGSSVDNKSLIRMFKDERIKIVENATNMGLPYSLNKALHVAKGKYIFRMDADDISCTNRLEVGVEFMEKNHAADIVGSFVRQVGAKHRTLKFPLDDNHIRATLVFGSPFVHPSIIFRAEKLKKNKIEYPMDAKSEDFNLWVAILSNKDIKFQNIPDVLLKYRVHDEQITKKNQHILRANTHIIHEKIFDKLGMKLSDEEMFAFLAFSKCDAKLYKDNIYLIKNVLKKILTQNELHRVFSHFAIRDVIRRRLIIVGLKQCIYYKNFSGMLRLYKLLLCLK